MDRKEVERCFLNDTSEHQIRIALNDGVGGLKNSENNSR